MTEKIIILDFGSQYTQLIARRIRELNTYCEIYPYNKYPKETDGIKGVILSGSPFSVNQAEAFKPDLSAFRGKLPLLGICYGAQLLVHYSGGTVEKPEAESLDAHLTTIQNNDPLMHNIPVHSQVWMSHGDTITTTPPQFQIIASTREVKIAAYRIDGEQTWGVQFHPKYTTVRMEAPCSIIL